MTRFNPYHAAALAIALALSAGGAARAAVTIADFQADFTPNANGHADGSGVGTWSYLSSETVDPADAGANLTLLLWDAGNSQYGEADYDPPQVRATNVHPNATDSVLVRWTNDGPTQLLYLDGLFQRQPATTGGNGVGVYVYAAGDGLHSSTIAPTTGNPTSPFSGVVKIGSGESIDMLVSSQGDLSFDRTNLSATISYAAAVTSGSFETPDLPSNGDTSTVNGWQESGGAFGGPGVQTDDKATSPTAADGNQWAFFNVRGATASEASASLWQDVGYASNGARYTVDFTLGGRSSQAPVSEFEVALWAGGSAPGGLGSMLIGSESVAIPVGSAVLDYSIDFFSGGGVIDGDTLWLLFTASVPENAGDLGNHQILLDAVSIAAVAVPTPAALPAGLGLLALGVLRRRRR